MERHTTADDYIGLIGKINEYIHEDDMMGEIFTMHIKRAKNTELEEKMSAICDDMEVI